LAARWPALRALRLSRNFGKEAALSAGLSQAAGAAVIVMDADLQHPPGLIREMVRLWAEDGYEVVNAVKRVREPEGPVKNLLTRLYFRLFSCLAGFEVGNATDFKLLDRCAVDSLSRLPERRTFFRGLVIWLGFRQATVSFDVPPRGGGQSSWSMGKLSLLALESILAFSTLPMHLMTLLGLGFAGVSVGLAARTLWLWLRGTAVPGFTTVILLLILIGAILMIGLGIIGAYVAKIYEEVKSRPRFVIQEELRGQALAAGDRDRTDRTAPAAAQGRGSRPAGSRSAA
jgi:glycosyltransferase involved in cell wall biosynthesis